MAVRDDQYSGAEAYFAGTRCRVGQNCKRLEEILSGVEGKFPLRMIRIFGNQPAWKNHVIRGPYRSVTQCFGLLGDVSDSLDYMLARIGADMRQNQPVFHGFLPATQGLAPARLLYAAFAGSGR